MMIRITTTKIYAAAAATRGGVVNTRLHLMDE
jgi:hypothetical protein